MNIQIVIPTTGCINNCKFCVSKLHDNKYEKVFDKFEIKKRIKYAVMNGVTTCVITGTGEPLQNKKFIQNLIEIFEEMSHPFPNVELQTTGVLLMTKETGYGNDFYPNIELLKKLGVNTINLSVSDIFNDIVNNEIIGTSGKNYIKLEELTKFIKNLGMNVRLTLNMTKRYDVIEDVYTIFDIARSLSADQITFRKFYVNNSSTEENEWIKENACSDKVFLKIKEYIYGTIIGIKHFIDKIDGHGKYLYTLPFGEKVFSIEEMSTVVDEDCMMKNDSDNIRYLILREDGKLYCRWDDKGSLIF
jgi:2-iminoacetate synthase ThiH